MAALVSADALKPSRYNLAVENGTDGQLIVFNTLYGSTAIVNACQMPVVRALLDRPVVDEEMRRANQALAGQLQRLRFIVKDDVDELEIVRQRKRAGIKDQNRLDLILMPNLDCNFACPYCYEQHDHRNRMTEVVERRLKNWLAKVIPGHKVVLLSWFGGEPLLSPATVISVTEEVRSLCERNGVRLLTNVTTNGYCLTPRLAQSLLRVGLTRYQITVDGTEATHNRTRVLRSGKGSFKRVYTNVVTVARLDANVRVSLRVNFNHDNILAIPEMLETFPADIRSQLRIVFEPIFGDSLLSATANLSAEDIARQTASYYELARTLGYDVRLGSLGVGRLVYCYAEREHQYIVDYKGDIHKCSVASFTASQRVGHLSDDGEIVAEPGNAKRWASLGAFEDSCEACTFLPLCMGGCRKDRVENGKTGSYCSLVPTNTSHTLKSVAYGSFGDVLRAATAQARRSGCVPHDSVECGSGT